MKRNIIIIAALVLCSALLRAEELPFGVGDRVKMTTKEDNVITMDVSEICGRWVFSKGFWYNLDGFKKLEIVSRAAPKN